MRTPICVIYVIFCCHMGHSIYPKLMGLPWKLIYKKKLGILDAPNGRWFVTILSVSFCSVKVSSIYYVVTFHGLADPLCTATIMYLKILKSKFFFTIFNSGRLPKIPFAPQSEFFSFSQDFFLDLLRSKKYIFSKHFRRLVNKIRKNVMCIVVLHVKLKPQGTKTLKMKAKSV